MTDHQAQAAVDRVARESYGRLVAYLASRSRDIAAAEDALADAFGLALRHWPKEGLPRTPEAWLLTAARRQLGKAERHARVIRSNEAELTRHIEEALEAMTHGEDGMADERLKLLFVCAHPAIAAEAQTPLMLQTVIGLDAARIARAFVVPPATMSQRLVRAKARIRDTGIRFAIPDTPELPARLDAVLQAIYAAFSAGWDAMDGVAGGELSDDAIWLGRTLVQLMPQQTEALSLLALMLHCHARRAARRRGDAFVPLAAQDTALWDDGLIAEADGLLVMASRGEGFGRFQCEAAIQSVHAARKATGRVDAAALETLYAALVRLAPTIGAQVAAAAACRDAARGLAMLDGVASEAISAYQPYHAVRADLLARLGRGAEATHAYEKAAALALDPAVRQFLLARMTQA
ncbi:MAG: RNA polymerase subunit sigma-70 [Alphaproteobacteria bacterium]|nr:RNA polymerase subunit sigma-70 [Alphaproteobacteria bacterium]